MNIAGWNIFLLGMAGTIRNGLVFKARQNRGVPVPDWVSVAHEKHNFNLSAKKKKKKKAGLKPMEQKTPKAKKKKKKIE